MCNIPTLVNRRQFCRLSAAALATTAASQVLSADPTGFRLKFIVASCVYGKAPLGQILAEVPKCGASEIDIWPLKWGNQREQIAAMGEERFMALLQQAGVRLGVLTRYDLGPFGLEEELHVAHRMGCPLIICGAAEAKVDVSEGDVRSFVDKMRPQVAVAQSLGVKIAIENHANTAVATPDSIRHFAELADSENLGLALAPYHLPQDAQLLSKLIDDVGHKLFHFYAWQHGVGSTQKQPSDQELLQMPGRGPLDFTPLLAALKRVNYQGCTEVFMHPFPRGIPIMDSIDGVTTEINCARHYLSQCLATTKT